MDELIKKEFKYEEGKDYNFIILLSSTVKDLGMFDVCFDYSYIYGYNYYGYASEVDGLGLDNLI